MNLDELERLEREATAGPWSSTPSDPSQGYGVLLDHCMS